MPKRWRIATYDPAQVARLERAAQVSTVVAQLLLGRGIDCPQRARQFIDAKLTDLRDPDQLPGVPQAAEILYRAVRDGKRIVVYGDYDADGMTATAILLRCLRLLKANVTFYVPHRIDEGYGMSCESLDHLAASGAQLVVTVDNGIACVAEAEHAQRLGIDLIITDHHQPGLKLPHAAAIVHPGLPGSNYPFTGLCGAAVALKVAWAVCQLASQSKRVQPAMREFLLDAVGLAAIGTVADVVPLIDENRALVRHGLTTLSSRPTPGVAALKQVAKLTNKAQLEGDDIAFSMAPRLNAAGRLGQAELGIELLATDSPERGMELARYIDELNAQRQSIERSVLLAARKQAKQHFDPAKHAALVLADRGWHPGVIGIVAGKLVEQYHRPVVLISHDELGTRPGVGSGRSVPGFDLHQAFSACTAQLVSHGGHAAAAGLRIEESQVAAFREAFCSVAAAQMGDATGVGEVIIDAEAPFAALTHRTISEIEQLAPFGQGNRRPMLCASGVRLASPPKPMGASGRHLALDLEQHGVRMRGVAFGGGEWIEDLNAAQGPLSVAFRPVLNAFRGRVNVEMHLTDWKRCDA